MAGELAPEAVALMKEEQARHAAAQAVRASDEARHAARQAANVAQSLPRIGHLYRVGVGVSIAGLLGLVVPSLLRAFAIKSDTADLVASSIVILIAGMVLVMPSLLTGVDGDFSTMRVTVLVVVMVFALLTVRAGWNATSLAELKLDNSWIGIIAMAFGGKVFQSFAERAGAGARTESGSGKLVRQGIR